jgi:uncharacterized membrane protein
MTTASIGAAAPTSAQLQAGQRIREIDILRGLVIVLMALDHVRDFFITGGSFAVNPLDPTQTTPLLYVTRWITHLCAPTFVFLTGVSAYLQFVKGKTTPNLSLFLLTRGLWLIVLELTVISFGWSFGFPYAPFMQVIWAIGWSMIALAALVWLPRLVVLGIGIAIIAGHNLLDPISAQALGEQSAALGYLWTFLHDGGVVFIGQQPIGLAAYPILPWVGVAAFGYGLGAVFLSETRNRIVPMLGVGMLALFVLLRWFNAYGDPQFAAGPEAVARLWTEQPTLMAQVMVFLDVQKYPPSLQFVLVALGLVFVLWPLLSRLPRAVASVLNTFGAVPFFFYVLHIYLVHLLAIAANLAFGRDARGLFNWLINGFEHPEYSVNAGFALWPWTYVAWIVVLALLYPLCRYWQGLKARRRDWWLSYL